MNLERELWELVKASLRWDPVREFPLAAEAHWACLTTRDQRRALVVEARR